MTLEIAEEEGSSTAQATEVKKEVGEKSTAGEKLIKTEEEIAESVVKWSTAKRAVTYMGGFTFCLQYSVIFTLMNFFSLKNEHMNHDWAN